MSKSVKSYGARGDGATNDSAAIQRAIDTYNGVLTIPPGVYRCSTALRLKPTTYLQGEGSASRINGGLIIEGSADPQTAWTILKDFVIDGALGAGITIGEALQPAYLHMKRLRVENCAGPGFHLVRGQQIGMVDCYAWRNGVGLLDTNNYLTTTLRVERCHFRESQLEGARLYTARSYTFKNCVFEANGSAGFLGESSGYGLTVEDCHFETNRLANPNGFELELLGGEWRNVYLGRLIMNNRDSLGGIYASRLRESLIDMPFIGGGNKVCVRTENTVSGRLRGGRDDACTYELDANMVREAF